MEAHKQSQSLKSLMTQTTNIRLNLQKKFQNPACNINLQHKQLNTDIYNFSLNKQIPKQQRAILLKHVSDNLGKFLNEFMKPKLKLLKNSAHDIVDNISRLWSDYQRLIYCYDWCLSKMKKYCQSYYKNSQQFSTIVGKDSILGTSAVMGISQLKHFIEKDFKELVQTFSKILCGFIQDERLKKIVPKQQIKQSLSFFEAGYFNYQAQIQRDKIDNKLRIIRKINIQLPNGLRSTEHSFFENNFLPKILKSIDFYNKFVTTRTGQLIPTQQIAEMRNIIHEQQFRSSEYIHTDKNREEYMNRLYKILIEQNIEVRIKKQDGLIKYFSKYNPSQDDKTKAEFEQQLIAFWDVYKRIKDKSLDLIKGIYGEYLLEEGKIVKSLIEKKIPFIDEIIRVHKKNNEILEIFEKNFQLKNLLRNNITKMLTNNLISNQSTGNFRGAKNLAFYIDSKFVTIYHKPNEKQLRADTLNNVSAIFQMLTQKDSFLKEHEKLTANRLIDEVDCSKQDEYQSIKTLQNDFLNTIRKQLGAAEVKNLTENLKDINKSDLNTKTIKANLSQKYPMINQIIIKTSAFWPETISYEIQNPPNQIFKQMNAIKKEMAVKGDIKFELNNGQSLFKGTFNKDKNSTMDQRFQFKNIYIIILLFIDQEPNDKMKFGDLLMKMRVSGSQGRKRITSNDLERNMIELLYAGLLKSDNKRIQQSEKDVTKVYPSDTFQIDKQFDFLKVQEKQKKKKISKMRIIPQKFITLPSWLQKAFKAQVDQRKIQQEQYEILKKNAIKNEVRRILKHAHNEKRSCTFQDFMTECSKIKQYPTTHKLMKEIVEGLINQSVCERVDDQRNTFKYCG